MRKIQIDDVVTCKMMNNITYTDKVTGIEIFNEQMGHKRFVKQCDLDKNKNGIVYLKSSWFYFHQIEHIAKRES